LSYKQVYPNTLSFSKFSLKTFVTLQLHSVGIIRGLVASYRNMPASLHFPIYLTEKLLEMIIVLGVTYKEIIYSSVFTK